MTQSYTSSKTRRDFNFYEFDEVSAYRLFMTLRWGGLDKQICPRCGVIDAHYARPKRSQWRCKGCGHDFSVTSGTAFAYRKLSFLKILAAIFEFSTTANGISANELSAKLQCQFHTAWLLTMKLREAIIKQNAYEQVRGHAQMDGAYMGGKRRSVNRHGAQRDDRAIAAKLEDPRSMRGKRRLNVSPGGAENRRRRLKRRTVFVLRQTHAQRGLGGTRTIVSIAMSENEVDAMNLAREFIAPGTQVMTDESGAFTALSTFCEHLTVVHSREFVGEDGTNDNQAESFFSRMRRAEYGVFHGYRPMYLIDYASEFAWRDDNRRQSIGWHVHTLLKLMLTKGSSRMWAGYFQGVRREQEILGPARASIANS